MLNEYPDFGKKFKQLREKEASESVSYHTNRLIEAQRDLDLYSSCIIEEALRPTPARIKAFLVGRIIESPLYNQSKSKDEIAKSLSALFLQNCRTWSEKYIKTHYKPKGGKERDINFRYNDRYKILVNETERIVLVFRQVTILFEDDCDLPPF